MNITIIGAGAMGSLFGSMLARAGENVFFVDIWEEHVNAINSKGLGVERDGRTSYIKIPSSTDIKDVPGSDLVIIFVKSTQTKQAAVQALKCLNDKGLVLTLQNGMGNPEKIAQVVHKDRIIAGTTAHGATMLGPGLIRHAGTGQTLVGMWSQTNNSGKKNAGLENIKKNFCKAGIETLIEEDIHLVIWKKLIINVGINAITALTGIKNGEILDFIPTKELVCSAVQEACDVALANGIQLPEDIVTQVFKIAGATGPNRSSMGQDVDNRRQTEIDAINGAIVKLAKEQNIPVPVNYTLTALVQTLQNHYK